MDWQQVAEVMNMAVAAVADAAVVVVPVAAENCSTVGSLRAVLVVAMVVVAAAVGGCSRCCARQSLAETNVTVQRTRSSS